MNQGADAESIDESRLESYAERPVCTRGRWLQWLRQSACVLCWQRNRERPYVSHSHFACSVELRLTITTGTTSDAALYAKAAIADMKAYRDAMQYRSIPIGYSAADLANLRKLQMDYFTCREGSADTSADFYAFNSYAWCGPSTFTQSGYDQLYKEAKDLDVPIFMSETGCNLDNRTWEDQVAMLGRDMNDRYSGNIIYEWSQESNGYGIVSYQNSDDPTGKSSFSSTHESE